jgi:hypothetical protein
MPVTPDSNVEGKRRKAQQGTDPKKNPKYPSSEYGVRDSWTTLAVYCFSFLKSAFRCANTIVYIQDS